MSNYPEKRHITTEEAVQILRDNGLKVSPQEAALLLDFLYLFAVFSITHYKKKYNENR